MTARANILARHQFDSNRIEFVSLIIRIEREFRLHVYPHIGDRTLRELVSGGRAGGQ